MVSRPIVLDYDARPSDFSLLSANLRGDYTRIRNDGFVAAGNQVEMFNAPSRDKRDRSLTN